MLTIVAALSLSASPSIHLMTERAPALPLTAGDPVDEVDQWLDDLIKLLEWLCEILDSSYCNEAAGFVADPHMLTFIGRYQDIGMPDTLSDEARFHAKELIADLYDHVAVDPMSGSPSVLAAMEEALFDAYVELGGAPSDLE